MMLENSIAPARQCDAPAWGLPTELSTFRNAMFRSGIFLFVRRSCSMLPGIAFMKRIARLFPIASLTNRGTIGKGWEL